MNAEHPAEKPALTSPPSPIVETSEGSPPRVPWVAVAAVLALLGVLVLGALAWQGNKRIDATYQELTQELTRRLADSDAVQREALDALQGKIGAFEAQLAQLQDQQIALQAVHQDISRLRDDRLLAEIEQNVTIAAQQLQLAGNVEAALIALRDVEARLAQSAQPQFLPLRKRITRDIERLKALPEADMGGIALKLDTLLGAVPNLPLAFERRPAPAARGRPATNVAGPGAISPEPTVESVLRAWLGELWHELRQLVRIERIDTQGMDAGLLTPREVFFLRENLRLRLLSARLALLARDGRSFQADLKQADAWLGQYFDTRVPSVQDAQTTLRRLIKLDVMREPVDLNETLSALRNFRLARDKR